jgi:hypothetical protein
LLIDFNNAKYWLDFMAEDSYLQQYNIRTIGDKIETIQDDYITGFHFNVPNIIYINNEQRTFNRSEYSTIIMDENMINNHFMMSR